MLYIKQGQNRLRYKPHVQNGSDSILNLVYLCKSWGKILLLDHSIINKVTEKENRIYKSCNSVQSLVFNTKHRIYTHVNAAFGL